MTSSRIVEHIRQRRAMGAIGRRKGKTLDETVGWYRRSRLYRRFQPQAVDDVIMGYMLDEPDFWLLPDGPQRQNAWAAYRAACQRFKL